MVWVKDDGAVSFYFLYIKRKIRLRDYVKARRAIKNYKGRERNA